MSLKKNRRPACRRGRSMNAVTAEKEYGSATVWLLGGMLAICAICALWITVAQAGLARQRAEVAADLAALAGAQAARSGRADPCAAAAEIAFRNGARLTGCTLTGETQVGVTVEVTSPMAAHAKARAGSVTD
jgi:secretion/DNA translocation related TadE-like protein